MNDWRAKGRQEYALGAIAMGQWGLWNIWGQWGMRIGPHLTWFARRNLFTDMNDWRAKRRQEYPLSAIAMGQWDPVEHMGTMGNVDLTQLDLIYKEKLVRRHEWLACEREARIRTWRNSHGAMGPGTYGDNGEWELDPTWLDLQGETCSQTWMVGVQKGGKNKHLRLTHDPFNWLKMSLVSKIYNSLGSLG